MLPIGLDAMASYWVKQGIADRVWGDLVLTVELRQWLRDNLGQEHGGDLWWWDHYREEDEVVIFFRKPQHAVMFKLAWL